MQGSPKRQIGSGITSSSGARRSLDAGTGVGNGVKKTGRVSTAFVSQYDKLWQSKSSLGLRASTGIPDAKLTNNPASAKMSIIAEDLKDVIAKIQNNFAFRAWQRRMRYQVEWLYMGNGRVLEGKIEVQYNKSQMMTCVLYVGDRKRRIPSRCNAYNVLSVLFILNQSLARTRNY